MLRTLPSQPAERKHHDEQADRGVDPSRPVSPGAQCTSHSPNAAISRVPTATSSTPIRVGAISAARGGVRPQTRRRRARVRRRTRTRPAGNTPALESGHLGREPFQAGKMEAPATNAVTRPQSGPWIPATRHQGGEAESAPPPQPSFACPEQARIDSSIPGGIAPVLQEGTEVSNASSEPRAGDPEDDSVQGLAMFVNFTGAVLFGTGPVALLALLGSGWMLGVAFAIHAAMTTVITLTLLPVMAGPGRAIPVGDRPSPTPTRWRRASSRSGARGRRCLLRDRHGRVPTWTRAALGAPAPAAIVGGQVIRIGFRPRHAGDGDRHTMGFGATPRARGHRRERGRGGPGSRALRPSPIRRGTSTSLQRPAGSPQSLTGEMDRARGCRRALRSVYDHMRADGRPWRTVSDEGLAVVVEQLESTDRSPGRAREVHATPRPADAGLSGVRGSDAGSGRLRRDGCHGADDLAARRGR